MKKLCTSVVLVAACASGQRATTPMPQELPKAARPAAPFREAAAPSAPGAPVGQSPAVPRPDDTTAARTAAPEQPAVETTAETSAKVLEQPAQEEPHAPAVRFRIIASMAAFQAETLTDCTDLYGLGGRRTIRDRTQRHGVHEIILVDLPCRTQFRGRPYYGVCSLPLAADGDPVYSVEYIYAPLSEWRESPMKRCLKEGGLWWESQSGGYRWPYEEPDAM
jgi:hypothetical protein